MSLASLLLADEFFLLAHDDVSGRQRSHSRVVGLGLAGALLGELILFDRITVHDDDDRVAVVRRDPPRDALTHTVLDQVIAEGQQHSVGTWLAYFAQTATDRVAFRLESAGHLTRIEHRKLMRRETVWVPTDMSVAATPGASLRHLLQNEKPLDVPEAVLAGLVEAVGLSPTVLWGVTSRTLQYRDWVLTNLPADLRRLVAETKAAVGNAVVAHRA